MPLRLPYTELSPEAYMQIIALNKAAMAVPLETVIKDLVRIRVSQLNDCLFCLDMHIKEAKLNGEENLRLHHLGAWQESALFTDREKAALAWAEAVTRLGGPGVPERDFEKVSAVFSKKEVSDLTFIIGVMNIWNRLGTAFTPEAGSLDTILGLDKAPVA